jgi:hypothetical protein
VLAMRDRQRLVGGHHVLDGPGKIGVDGDFLR